MDNLPIEIMVIILDLLDFKSQVRFIFATKTNEYLIEYLTITEMIFMDEKVLKWPYYNNLINIKINKLLEIYPKKLQYVSFNWTFNKLIKNLPLTVTHLYLGHDYLL